MTATKPTSVPSIQLTEEHIQKIKSSIPLLADAGVEVTEYFYRRMFSHNPELNNILMLAIKSQGSSLWPCSLLWLTLRLILIMFKLYR